MSKKGKERSIISNYDIKRKSVIVSYIIMVLFIVLIAISMIYPFLTTILSAFKTKQETYIFPPTLFPKEWIWSNFKEGFEYVDMMRLFGNTLLIYLGNIISSLTVIGLASFSLSQMKLPFRKFFTLFFLCTLLIPSATYMIPNFLNLQSLGLIDSYWAFWLPAGCNAFYILLLKGFFDGIHKELFEAARIDGASEVRCFLQVAIPLSVPVLATIMIFTFTSTWNDWFWPSLIIQTPEKYPIATGVYKTIVTSGNLAWNVKFAALTLTMLPPLIFFLIFQKNIMKGVNISGGIKG